MAFFLFRLIGFRASRSQDQVHCSHSIPSVLSFNVDLFQSNFYGNLFQYIYLVFGFLFVKFMAFYHLSIIFIDFQCISSFTAFCSGIPYPSVSHFVEISYLTFTGIQLTGCHMMQHLGVRNLEPDYKQFYICVYVCLYMCGQAKKVALYQNMYF